MKRETVKTDSQTEIYVKTVTHTFQTAMLKHGFTQHSLKI
jgi:hypothetical protein